MSIKPIVRNGFRHYPINGNLYISVTTVFKVLNKGKFLDKWQKDRVIDIFKKRKKVNAEVITEALNNPKKVLMTSADKGTGIHKMIENYLKTGEVVKNIYLDRFITFEKKYNFKMELTEQFVYDEEYEYAGTLDLFGTCNGVPVLIDLKSSKGVYLSHKMQGMAYKRALKRKCRVGILALGKTDDFQLIRKEEEKPLLKGFLYLRLLFNLLDSLGELEAYT